MRRIILWVLSGVALVVTGLLLYQMTRPHSERRLEAIDVLVEIGEGAPRFMNEADVLSEMKRMGIDNIGSPIDSIDLVEVRQRLTDNPIFSDVEVYISTRSPRMKVRVRQRDAFFLVATDKPYYVTRERGILPLNARYAVYVPVVSGAVTSELATGALYDLMEMIEQDEYFRHYFGQVYVDPVEGIVLVPRVGTARIILGAEGDWRAMLDKLRIFDREVIPRKAKGWDTFEYIKLPYGQQVVVRERDRTPTTTPEPVL